MGTRISDLNIRKDDVPDTEWHTTMNQFLDGHYEQTAIYTNAKNGEKASHLLLSEASEPIGGARVGMIVLPVIKRGLALLRFGPFWRHQTVATDRDRYRKVIQVLVDEYCKRQRHYLIIRPRPHPDFYQLEANLLEDLGFRGSQSTKLDHYFVNLALSEEEQSKSLDQKWRYNLKLGLKNDLKISISELPGDIRAFQSIYKDMVKRKRLNYPGVNMPDSIPGLTQLPDNLRMKIVLAFHQEKPVAGIAFSVVGDLAYYVFGATNDKASELRAGYALQWFVLRWLREHSNARWYDLGGTGDPGIQQFKKGFAGKRGFLLSAEEFHYSPDLTAKLLAKSFFVIRNARNTVQRWQRESSQRQRRR